MLSTPRIPFSHVLTASTCVAIGTTGIACSGAPVWPLCLVVAAVCFVRWLWFGLIGNPEQGDDEAVAWGLALFSAAGTRALEFSMSAWLASPDQGAPPEAVPLVACGTAFLIFVGLAIYVGNATVEPTSAREGC